MKDNAFNPAKNDQNKLCVFTRNLWFTAKIFLLARIGVRTKIVARVRVYFSFPKPPKPT
jgi:hypothetical protein